MESKVRGRRVGQRYNTLSLDEEAVLQEKGEDFIAQQLQAVIPDVSMMNIGESRAKRRLANSLVFIWVKMKPDQVRRNMWLAMVANDVFTIKELSEKSGVNTSNLSRAFNLKHPRDFSKWNTDLLFPVAQALGVRPELLLEMDLTKIVLEFVVNWQI